MKPSENKKKKKHPVRNTLLVILALLIIAVAVFLFVNRKNVMRLYKGVSYSSEEIASMQQENDKKTDDLLNELAVGTMRDLTDEERALLASGELSESDAISLIQGLMPPLNFGDTTDVPDTTDAPDASDAPVTDVADPVTTSAAAPESTAPSDTSVTEEITAIPEQTTEVPEESTAVSTTVTEPEETEELTLSEQEALQARISEIIAEIYLLRATYLNKIDTLIEDAKQKYIALPVSQHGISAKLRIVENTLMPQGEKLEKECDASMKKLLDELKGILIQLNLSTEIIGEIEKAYEEQKDLKMAELYNKYAPSLQ